MTGRGHLVVLALWLAAAPVAAAPAAGVPLFKRGSGVRVESLDGKALDPLARSAMSRAAVFVFVSIDCPISNRYAPEVRRLQQAFGEKGVAFTLVYPNPAESAAAIRDHLRAYNFPLTAVRDPTHALVRHAQVSVTPEVAVFTPDGALAYRGRIDNRYVSLGVERPAATQHDLAAALTALLDGRPVREPRTRAVGCYVADFAR